MQQKVRNSQLRMLVAAWHSAAAAQSATHKHFQVIVQQMAFTRLLKAWRNLAEQQVCCKATAVAVWRQHLEWKRRKERLLLAAVHQRRHR